MLRDLYWRLYWYCWVCQLKNFENHSAFDEVTKLWLCIWWFAYLLFMDHTVRPDVCNFSNFKSVFWRFFQIFIRPPVRSNGRSLKMLVMFFFFFFFAAKSRSSLGRSPRNFATWSEPALFYKLTPKIREALPPKNWGPKTCKISVDFIQPSTLIANISGTAQDIQNLKTNSSTAIPPALYEKGGELWSTNYRD